MLKPLKIFILCTIFALFGLLPGCSKSDKHKTLAVDKFVFAKGTFVNKYKDNFPDSLNGKSPDNYMVFKSREILKVVDRYAYIYLNEYNNPQRGYFKAELDDSTISLINNYLITLNFDYIYDSTLSSQYPDWIVQYDGYSFNLFMTDNYKTKYISYIDFPMYNKQFTTFKGIIENLSNGLKLERLADSINVKSEFDSLNQSIVHRNSHKMLRLAKIEYLPPLIKH